MILLGLGAVWVGKHAPVPSNKPSSSELARDRKLERAYRARGRRLHARARRRRQLERARNLWARRANTICRSVVRADRAALGRITRIQSPTELLDLLETLEGTSRRVLDELEALPPPPGRAARVRRMLSLYEKAFALDQAAVEAIRRGDRPGFIRVVQRELRLGELGGAIARDLDANVCADGVFADPS
jgi:hypothetical protein